MHFYAQIRDGRVVGVTQTARTVEAPEMVPIEGLDTSLLGMVYAGGQFIPPPVAPPSIPQAVTMRQARLALHAAGALAGVQVAIDALEEPAKTEAQITWEYSTEVQRQNGLVSQLGPALGLSEAQIDALFTAAALL